MQDRVDGFVLSAEVRPGASKTSKYRTTTIPKKRLPWENARELLKAGYKVAIRPASDNDLPDSLFTAGLFLSGGLTTEKVIQMMTAYPAELLASPIGSAHWRRETLDSRRAQRRPIRHAPRVLEVLLTANRPMRPKPLLRRPSCKPAASTRDQGRSFPTVRSSSKGNGCAAWAVTCPRRPTRPFVAITGASSFRASFISARPRTGRAADLTGRSRLTVRRTLGFGGPPPAASLVKVASQRFCWQAVVAAQAP